MVDADAREIDGYSFTHRLKFGGTGSTDARMLSFKVDGDCVIDIYLMSASGSADRILMWTMVVLEIHFNNYLHMEALFQKARCITLVEQRQYISILQVAA